MMPTMIHRLPLHVLLLLGSPLLLRLPSSRISQPVPPWSPSRIVLPCEARRILPRHKPSCCTPWNFVRTKT